MLFQIMNHLNVEIDQVESERTETALRSYANKVQAPIENLQAAGYTVKRIFRPNDKAAVGDGVLVRAGFIRTERRARAVATAVYHDGSIVVECPTNDHNGNDRPGSYVVSEDGYEIDPEGPVGVLREFICLNRHCCNNHVEGFVERQKTTFDFCPNCGSGIVTKPSNQNFEESHRRACDLTAMYPQASDMYGRHLQIVLCLETYVKDSITFGAEHHREMNREVLNRMHATRHAILPETEGRF